MENNKTVLIVEDNQVNLRLIRDIIESQGYKVIEAYDGNQAISSSIEHSKEIDLILMDIQLPKLSGLDAIKAIKANESTKEIPIIVVSAHAMTGDIEKAKEAGCIDYITKPINLAQFIETINNFFDET